MPTFAVPTPNKNIPHGRWGTITTAELLEDTDNPGKARIILTLANVTNAPHTIRRTEKLAELYIAQQPEIMRDLAETTKAIGNFDPEVDLAVATTNEPLWANLKKRPLTPCHPEPTSASTAPTRNLCHYDRPIHEELPTNPDNNTKFDYETEDESTATIPLFQDQPIPPEANYDRNPTENINTQKKHQHTTRTYLTTVRTLKVNIARKPYAVAVTERLPHMIFPIGPGSQSSWRHLPTVRGIFDTGSGVTIGYLPYWTCVADKYPHLIEEFCEMDTAVFQELKVGGIQKEGEGALCTHYIVLRTPFITDGQPVTIRVALTNELSCNLIFGLPFIVKSKMSAHLWDKYVSSAVFQTTFPLEFHAPETREEVIMQDNSTVTLKTSPGHGPKTN